MQPEPSYSVAQLMVAFRQALVSLIPSAEAVGVTWKQFEAYDGWDLIEEVLFEVTSLLLFVVTWPCSTRRGLSPSTA